MTTHVNPNLDPRVPRTVKILILMGITVIAAVMVVYGIRIARSAHIPGVVIDTERTKQYDNSGGYNIIHQYSYSYEVEGRKYQGTERTLLPFLHKTGSSMTVHCSPEDPSATYGSFLFEAGGFLLMFFIICLLLLQSMT